jgi:tRNA wybutosine-synthesizing protein 4
LDAENRKRIERLEIFDEFEEWEMLQSHYCLCLGKRIENDEVNELIYL